MTFSIIARDVRTGQIGMAATTSDVGVGARVLHGRARIGGVLTQHTTDPRLGTRGVELLADGLSAQATLDALIASATCPAARQLAVIDATGGTAVFDGEYVDRSRSFSAAVQSVAVIGNVLASPEVGAAVLRRFLEDDGVDLAARLLAALRAGRDAGGEGVPLVSAGLLVVDEQSFPYVDLRVDLAAVDPIDELIALNDRFTPKRDDYVRRAIDPDVSYAFPGGQP